MCRVALYLIQSTLDILTLRNVMSTSSNESISKLLVEVMVGFTVWVSKKKLTCTCKVTYS